MKISEIVNQSYQIILEKNVNVNTNTFKDDFDNEVEFNQVQKPAAFKSRDGVHMLVCYYENLLDYDYFDFGSLANSEESFFEPNIEMEIENVAFKIFTREDGLMMVSDLSEFLIANPEYDLIEFDEIK